VTLRLRLFAAARQAAGLGSDEFDLPDGTSLREMLAAACVRYGPEFGNVLSGARVWVDGDEPARGSETVLADGNEVAVLPPVSGGAVPADT
jgi:molybdopterin converting factor small subunit